MKKISLLVSLIFTTILTAKDGVKVLISDANSVTLEFNFGELKQQVVSINGTNYNKLYNENCVPVLNLGFPQILRNAVSIALPANASPNIQVISSQFKEITNYPVAPSKGSLTRNIDPNSVPYTFGSAYSKNEFYPNAVCEVTSIYDLRHQKGAAISFYPVQANPLTNTIKVYQSIVVKITYVDKRNAKLKLETPKFNSNEEGKFLQSQFINLTPTSNNLNRTQYTPLNEFGSMLIISHPTFTNNMQPLVDWKNQKGISTKMVSSAVTGTTQASILAYIQTYYSQNPNLLYVLLVGDHEQINSFNAGPAGSETKWSDSKYGMLSGNDWYPEVMVGRFSGTTVNEINTMVNRTLEYEKNPTIGNWWGKGIGIGSNEGYGYGDDGEADWVHIRNIGNKLISGAGYNYYHEFYDSTHGGNDAPGDPNPTIVSNAVNSGAGIFLYSGHGSQNSCATSNYAISNINAATNYGKYPFSIQVACNNGTFINGTCFSEAFVRASGSGTLGPKGAIASCGSSILMAWAEPMQTQDEIGDIISNQYANNKKFTLGGLFYCGQMSMLDKYPTVTGKEVMETWVMFGDPSCTFRSASPSNIVATHNNCIDVNATTFSVSSTYSLNTFAAISQNNQVIGSSILTNSVSNINLTQALNPALPVNITITQYNTVPYTATVGICGGVVTSLKNNTSNALISVQSLVKETCAINYNFENSTKDLIITLFDLTGKEIIKQNYSNLQNTGKLLLPLEQLTSGIYLVKISDTKNENLNVSKIIKE